MLVAAKAPNVVVSSQSGEPGASSYIQIRGNRTIQSTGQPLFVVDGVPIDNDTYSTTANTGGTVTTNRSSDVNPNDIESVEILKGSAAAAIYGSAAGQGVVMITTKSGHAGATRYSFQGNYSTDKVTHAVPLQTTYGQGFGRGRRYLRRARLPGGLIGAYGHHRTFYLLDGLRQRVRLCAEHGRQCHDYDADQHHVQSVQNDSFHWVPLLMPEQASCLQANDLQSPALSGAPKFQ